MSEKERQALIKKVELQRMVRDSENAKVIFRNVDTYNLQLLANDVKIAEQSGLGNCCEFSSLVFGALLKLGIQIPIERYTIENGDHIFIVIGRDRNSDPRDFTTWGDKAVVIDAWSGDVYPANQIPTHLRCYYYYDNELADGARQTRAITFPFNDKIHVLTHDFSHEIKLTDSFYACNESVAQYCFSREELEEIARNEKLIELTVQPKKSISTTIFNNDSIIFQPSQKRKLNSMNADKHNKLESKAKYARTEFK